jgi:hypothetical protein
MLHDRIDGDRFSITHDYIAQMLGIHRPSVTIAALDFKNQGLIDYSRGKISIVDRRGLEREACECYGLISKTYQSYLELLELRHLNDRMYQVNRQMAAVMEKKREIEKVTSFRVENLKRAIHELKSARGEYSLCAVCHRVRNGAGDWQDLVDFVQRYRSINLKQDICPCCREKM